VEGALNSLKSRDLVIIHIEAPDEAAHAGAIDHKIEAIERVDEEIIPRLRSYYTSSLRILIMPDHPTPIKVQTHTGDPVPFMLWGDGFAANGARRFTEVEAKKPGLFLDPGYNIINRLIKR